MNRKLQLKAADWLPQLDCAEGQHFSAAAEWLGEQGVGKEEVSKAIDFLSNKNRKSGFTDVWAILGIEAPAKGKAAPKAKAKAAAAPAAAAPVTAKEMVTTAWLAGKISLAEFKEAIAALEGSTAKAVEAPVESGTLDLTGTDGESDLPF